MNPFKENGQILPIASINSVYINSTLASDLFRPELIINELKKNRDILGFSSDISDTEMFIEFNETLNSNIDEVRIIAKKIAVYFGKNLAELIITLKKPSIESIMNRPSWQKTHWDFWRGVENIYFVGGLTSPILTSIFYTQITNELSKNMINDLKVCFIEGSMNLGTKGLCNLTADGTHLLFDFGQTNIKRRYLIKRNNEIVIDSILEPRDSKFLDHKNKSNNELKDSSIKLDNYIISTIMDSVNTVKFNGNNIFIAIANYLVDGFIYSKRGGYAKLALIKGNYETHLSNEISKLLSRKIKVKLFHDTSAMALNFDSIKRTAVISLGTAFGIAFPE